MQRSLHSGSVPRAVLGIRASVFGILLLSGSLALPAQQEIDDLTIDVDTLDFSIDDELLRLQLRPLELGTCSVEDLARLPGIGLRTAEAILRGIDSGAIRSWSGLRLATSMDADDLDFLRKHARLPSRRARRPASFMTRAEVATEGASRRGFRSMQQRIVGGPSRDDTLSIGPLFLGSPVALRLEGTFVGDPVTVMYRASKDAGEPWFAKDTLAFTYVKNERIDTGTSTGERAIRRGASVGLAAEWDIEPWSILMGDFRLSLIAPMTAVFRQGVDAIRRGGLRDRRRISMAPMFGEYGYLRGIAIRVGQTRLPQLMPAIHAALSVRDYSAASLDSSVNISTDGQRRTRIDLRRSGAVRESSAIGGISFRQRRWGVDGDILSWRRTALVNASRTSSGTYLEGGAWLRYGLGWGTAYAAHWDSGMTFGGVLVHPLGFVGEIAAIVRGTTGRASVRLPGGTSTPSPGVEWSVAARWKASRGEITELQAGLRRAPPRASAPFGLLVTRAEVRREIRTDLDAVRGWVAVEREAISVVDAPTGRRRSTLELTTIGGIRGEWRRGSSRLRGGITARTIQRSGEPVKLGFVGVLELRYPLMAKVTGQVRFALHRTDVGVTIADAAPSFRGRGALISLTGRGCRTTLEAETSPSTEVKFAAGLDFRTRSDRARILDDGDDTIDAHEHAIVWGTVTIRH